GGGDDLRLAVVVQVGGGDEDAALEVDVGLEAGDDRLGAPQGGGAVEDDHLGLAALSGGGDQVVGAVAVDVTQRDAGVAGGAAERLGLEAVEAGAGEGRSVRGVDGQFGVLRLGDAADAGDEQPPGRDAAIFQRLEAQGELPHRTTTRLAAAE